MKKYITEGLAVFNGSSGLVSREMEVFYNPVSAFNRSITVALLNSLPNKSLKVGLPLEASGVRGVRILKEVKKEVFAEFNDISPKAVLAIKNNLKLNKLKANVSNMDASQFLLASRGFDFIDIDPFGSPNPFLDAAVKKLSRNGVLGVTATDTAPLAGTYPTACYRKYWAKPLKNEFMHETAIRILIRKIQLIGAQYDHALIPIFSYFKDHYYRVFFLYEKSKNKTDALLKQHGKIYYCRKCLSRLTTEKRGCKCSSEIEIAGPLWLGKLHSAPTVEEMLRSSGPEIRSFLETVLSETRVNSIGFVTMGALGRCLKMENLPKRDELIESLKEKGFKAGKTHFSPEGIAVLGNPDWKKIIRGLKSKRSTC